MNNVIYKYIVKYSLILAACYLVTYIANLSLQYMEIPDVDSSMQSLIFSIPNFLAMFFNLVIALIVNRDIRKLNLQAKYVVVATLFFRPVGVCAFLLYLISEHRKAMGEQSEGVLG